MFASKGEATPPCGVPTSGRVTSPSSMTPAFSHLRIKRITRRSPARCSTKRINHSWSTASKNPAMSASNTQFILVLPIPTASVLNQKFLSTLALDGDCAMTKPFDGGQDVVGGFGPAKGLGVGIAGVDVDGDGGLQRGSRAVGAALDLLLGEQREEALDRVDP